MGLDKLRAEIDQIDNQIVYLLGERVKLVQRVGELKLNRTGIKDANREEQILRRVTRLAEKQGVSPLLVERIFRLMFRYFINQQRKICQEYATAQSK